MSLLQRINPNTNINTQAEAPAQVAQPAQQVAQPTGFFPQTQATSAGSEYTNQNMRVGEFQGVLKALRPIKSQKNPTVFAVIDIEVPGEQGVFQDFLNFNPAKASQTMSYLVNHTKSMLTSAGIQVDPNEVCDMTWVETKIKELVAAGAPLRFTQTSNQRGLTINYL